MIKKLKIPKIEPYATTFLGLGARIGGCVEGVWFGVGESKLRVFDLDCKR